MGFFTPAWCESPPIQIVYTPILERANSVALSFVSQGKNTCILKGFGLPQGSGPLYMFMAEPALLSFAAKTGQAAVQTVVVKNIGDQAGAPVVVFSNQKFSVASGAIGVLQPLASAVVSIQCDSAQAGTFNAQASFAINGENYLDLASQITAAGPKYVISPATWNFGSLAYNAGKQTKEFTIHR